MKMKIKVTQEHIDKAIKFREEEKPADLANCCPIYWAIKEQGYDYVRVNKKMLIVDDKTLWLPQAAMTFIGHFDLKNYIEVKPIEFEV